MRRFRNQPNIAQKLMASAAAIFGKCSNICMITFNLLFSTYMLLQCCFMLYFNVIILVRCPSHLLKLLPAWTSVKMWTTVERDFCTTCYERPPVLSDRFCWAEGVVAQDRFYCKCRWQTFIITSYYRTGGRRSAALPSR